MRELKFHILRRGLSQRIVARLTQIPETRLSSIINGWANPRPEERRELERVLGGGSEMFETRVETDQVMSPNVETR